MTRKSVFYHVVRRPYFCKSKTKINMHIKDVIDRLIPSKGLVATIDVFTKDGAIMHMKDVVCVADYRDGTRLMKFVNNPTIKRQIRDNLIIRFNDEEIYI